MEVKILVKLSVIRVRTQEFGRKLEKKLKILKIHNLLYGWIMTIFSLLYSTLELRHNSSDRYKAKNTWQVFELVVHTFMHRLKVANPCDSLFHRYHQYHQSAWSLHCKCSIYNTHLLPKDC